ncbi:unnamed protein product [Cuscuta campestris]|uniref:Uncharacterized protein n=1 Tax=Cuscuta campestris TaxID=132261 RepID=A0A484NIN6_9ASTE|nr:unnamed protein product [Cuscuta campestris]
MPGQVSAERDEPVDNEPTPYDPDNESWEEWEERLRAAVSPGGTGCEGFVYFKGRTGRKFISDVPQSNRGWKEKFVFIEFPPFVTPLAGLKWNDHLLNHEYAAPASSPDLEASVEILLRGDPFTGRKYNYGSWVWRVEPGGEGTSQAHDAAGRGVPSPGNIAEAEGNSHPDMEFEEFAMPEDKPEGEAGDSQAGAATTFTVQPETVEIHDEEEPEDDRSKGKGKEKAGRRIKKVATSHPSFSKKRQRGDSNPVSQTIEEAFINLGLREIGPHAVEHLGMGSPSELARLKKEKEEMSLILKSQADELIRLSGMAGTMKVEISQLKKENGRLMDEVSEAKKEMALKEESFPGRAATLVGENKAEAARVMTATPETTMESFRLLYREPEGKKMITTIGSFGFKSGQKKDRSTIWASLMTGHGWNTPIRVHLKD